MRIGQQARRRRRSRRDSRGAGRSRARDAARRESATAGVAGGPDDPGLGREAGQAQPRDASAGDQGAAGVGPHRSRQAAGDPHVPAHQRGLRHRVRLLAHAGPTRTSATKTDNAMTIGPIKSGELPGLLQPAVRARAGARLRRHDHGVHPEVGSARGRRGAGKGAGTMAFTFGPRRGTYVDIAAVMPPGGPLTPAELDHFEAFDLLYRSLCALLFNYVPTSGHPGGSISSGRFVAAALFDAMDYELGDPERPDADLISYAAGHKAMGLYAMWALRDEVARSGRPGAAARTAGAAPAPGGPPRVQAQPHHADPALPRVRRPGARRAPDAGDPVRQARDGRLRRRLRQLHRARHRRGRPLRRRRAAGAHRRGRGRPDARPRGRVPGRGRHRLARQRHRAPRLEPGVASTRTASAARASCPATTCSGTRASSSTCTTGT